MYRQQSKFSIQQGVFMEIAGRRFPFLAVVWYSNTNEIKGDPSGVRGGMEGSVDQFKNSTVIVTVILCVLILAFLIFVLWQSHSSSPTIPTDPELLEQEWGGGARHRRFRFRRWIRRQRRDGCQRQCHCGLKLRQRRQLWKYWLRLGRFFWEWECLGG